MNKRIDKLFGQALDEIVPDTWTNLTQDQLNDIKNRFSELLIRECSKIVLNCGIPGSNNERDFIVASREIKQHFGVEE